MIGSDSAALVNGGTVWKPRLVDEIRTESGELVTENPATVVNVVEDLSPSTVRSLRNDLSRVVNDSRGTAHAAFFDFGDNLDQVGGKTGTAEIIKRRLDEDTGQIVQEAVTTALFVGAAPIDDPDWVVVVIILLTEVPKTVSNSPCQSAPLPIMAVNSMTNPL